MLNYLRRHWQWGAALVLLPLLAGCAVQPVQPTQAEAAPAADVQETAAETAAEDAAAKDAVAEEAVTEEVSVLIAESELNLLPAETPPFGTTGWITDFDKRTIAWHEILSGGPPKDGIPSVDNPTFESIDAATARLTDQDPVVVFGHEGDNRAYPLNILIWHEIVNDEVGGKPVTITFCPLCNASIVFDRAFDGEIRDFGTTGRLRNSDLIMYDRQSETWWQQFTGEGLVGEYAGQQLTFLPSQVLSFADFAELYPDGQVLAVPTEFGRDYGRNPYAGYDSTSNPFLFRGEIDQRLPATERVVGVDLDGVEMAYSFVDAAEEEVINDVVAETPLVIFHKAGTASALDASNISEGKDIGSVGVFSRQVGDQALTFTANGDGTFTDDETGSTWNILGEATAGELEGAQLGTVLSFDHFWFAWAAFFPETGLYGG